MSWIQSDINSTSSERYVPPSWSTGTDEEILTAVNKHYAGEVDLTQYWSVGDERVVHLYSIPSSSCVSESHAEQDITLVLMNVGGKELVTPINEISECIFIVGQKNCLSETGEFTKSNGSSESTYYGWSGSTRRKWCNSSYRYAFPGKIRQLFKQHYNYVASSNSSTAPLQTADYFCLPSIKEVTGAVTGGNGYTAYSGAEAENSQFEYYVNNSANKVKYVGEEAVNYWTSSKVYTTKTSSMAYVFYINNTGAADVSSSTATTYGIAPFGVI